MKMRTECSLAGTRGTVHDLFRRHQAPSPLSVASVIGTNDRIEIISNRGRPLDLPKQWLPVLGQLDALVLIPDMHMFLYTSNLDNFRFGAEAMLDFLRHLVGLKRELEKGGLRLGVCQLGDMYELCFPGPTGGIVTVDDIAQSHPIYNEIISLFQRLETVFIAGNHDISHHRHSPSRLVQRCGRVLMEHGFAADRWYRFTDPSKPGWSLTTRGLKTVRRVESSLHRLSRRLGRLDAHDHIAVGVQSGAIDRRDYPMHSEYPNHALRHYARRISQLHWYDRPRICAVAHTHMPFVDATFLDGECVYVDAGAWTEGRSDFGVITNSEVAVCRYRRSRRVVSGDTAAAGRPRKARSKLRELLPERIHIGLRTRTA